MLLRLPWDQIHVTKTTRHGAHFDPDRITRLPVNPSADGMIV